jgi:hypothetical protein
VSARIHNSYYGTTFSCISIGFGVERAAVDGISVCRMFNYAATGESMPARVSTDHDPLFHFHRWLANLRELEIEEIKSVPYAQTSRDHLQHRNDRRCTRMSRSTPPWTPARGHSHSIHNLGEAEALMVLRCEKISRTVQSFPRGARGSTNAFPHRPGPAFRPTGQHDRGIHDWAELKHRLLSATRRSARPFIHAAAAIP